MTTSMPSPKSLGVSEYYATDADRHSTLQPVPNYSTLEPVPYQAHDDGYGTKNMEDGKPKGRFNDLEGGAGEKQGGFWKRKVCGVSMVVVGVILSIVILGAIGGGVGGALASANTKDTADKDSNQGPMPVSTIINADGQTVTITATPTAATEIVTGASSSSTSTRPSSLPPYPTKALAANTWHKIGISRRSFVESTSPQQLEARWEDNNSLGSIGIAPNSSDSDQTWQLLAVPQSNENSKRVYENEAEAGGLTALYYVACLRFSQQVRMVVDNADVDRYKDSGDGSIGITMARADEAEPGQFWWLEKVESEVQGDPQAFVLHNLKSGKKWRLKWSLNREGVLIASMLAGQPNNTSQIGLRDDVWDVTKLGRIGSQDGWFIYD